jgi:hypothetical protein
MVKLTIYVIDLIAFWAAYNFLHIIKLNYINKLLGITDTNEYFNRLSNDNNYLGENRENIINLAFYFIILIICLYVYNNYNN